MYDVNTCSLNNSCKQRFTGQNFSTRSEYANKRCSETSVTQYQQMCSTCARVCAFVECYVFLTLNYFYSLSIHTCIRLCSVHLSYKNLTN